ncbi:hypothetical protein L9F63_003192, partial [Diploptera punctata]
MNILFRKHFHGESDRGGYGKVGGSKGVKGKRSRESGYTVMEEHHYRTHIFLSPVGGGCQGCLESEMTQRRPSVTLMKWAVGGVGSGNRRKPSGRTEMVPETPTPTASRQVSFSSGARTGTGSYNTATSPTAANREPVTLATLNRDCFIIPVASLDRFLPAGVP